MLPKVEVSGGPLGKNLKIKIDGEELQGATHAEIVLDVNDVVVLKTTQLVEAIVEVESALVINKARVRAYLPGSEGAALEVIAESTADTIWQALYDCARQLELAARRVAQSGTISESSGRPPGH